MHFREQLSIQPADTISNINSDNTLLDIKVPWTTTLRNAQVQTMLGEDIQFPVLDDHGNSKLTDSPPTSSLLSSHYSSGLEGIVVSAPLRRKNNCHHIKRFTGKNQSYQIERSPYQLRKRRRRLNGIAAVTIGKEACLLLRNKENRITTVSIRLKQISHICKQKTEYFTRDYEFFTESRHQCYNTESCRGNTCESLEDETIRFSMIAKSNPDTHTVYQAVYAFGATVPTSSTIYRVFSCPTWSIQAEGNRHAKNRRFYYCSTLHSPARNPFTWNNLRLTFAGTILPNLPILSSYFITDGNIVTRIEPSQQGQLLPNSAGQLQCRTEEEAKSFGSCIFAQYACSCNPRKYAVTCSCPNGTTSSFLHNKHNKLPVITGQAALINERQTIKAKTTRLCAHEQGINKRTSHWHSSIQQQSCRVRYR
ncbi:hypothetical protein COOONC_18096 [Cooperia oncophora]